MPTTAFALAGVLAATFVLGCAASVSREEVGSPAKPVAALAASSPNLCATLERESAKVDLAALKLPPYVACKLGRSGAAYGVKVDGVDVFVDKSVGHPAHLVRLSLVRIGLDGQRIVHPLDTFNARDDAHAAGTIIPDGFETQELSPFKLVDVDDDGEPEVWFDFYRKTEGAGQKRLLLAALRRRAVRPVSSSKGLRRRGATGGRHRRWQA